jgi:predicted SPOUT superfamily RNA methylase MTH1
LKTLKEASLPIQRTQKVSIAIPASFISDIPHLREKTFRTGLVGRAAAIFRIDEVIVYPDMPNVDQTRDVELIVLILSYIETPQYLRKKLFRIRSELRYAGVLPPLRTPHHPVINRLKKLDIGEYREGIVVSSSTKGSFVDVGVEQPALIQRKQLPLNTRVTVEITRLQKQFLAILVSREKPKTYWGYKVATSNVPLGQLVKRRGFDLVIMTSRMGKAIIEVMEKLREKWKVSDNVLVAFGAPAQGLYEILAHERLKLEEVSHFILNTIPCQGTKTVRTEEAIYTTLAILNTLR